MILSYFFSPAISVYRGEDREVQIFFLFSIFENHRQHRVLGQSYSSDQRQLGLPSKNPTSTINHPSTTMPPEKTGNLTEFEKGQIVALKEKSLSFSEIGKILSRPKSTVLSFYNRFQKRGDVKNLPMPGRHKIIHTRTHRRLVREFKKARHLPLSELRNEVAPHASVKTIKQALASVNIKKWRAVTILSSSGDTCSR